MTTDITLIEHKEMTSEEKQIFFTKLANLNKTTVYYLDLIKSKLDTKFSMEKFRKIFLKADSNVDLEVFGVLIKSEDLKKMQSVKLYEERALASVGKLLHKLAYNASLHRNNQLEFEDYYNEAVLAGINAVYSYCDPNIKFTTFIQTSIINKFKNENNSNRFSSAVCQKTRKNFRNYSILKEKHPNLEQEELFKMMNLNNREIFALKSMFTTFTPVSQYGDSESENSNFLYEQVDNRKKNVLLEEFDKIISETEMTSWERTVLMAFLNGKDHGWASEIAEKTINPETKLPYSRRAPRLALDRVLERIRQKYFSDLKEGDVFSGAA